MSLIERKTKSNQTSPRQSGSFLSLTYLAFFLSGVAGLGYQVIWTRGFALGLGHEMPSLIAILSAIFLGFALGSWGIEKFFPRVKRFGLLFVVLELIAALWSALTTLLIPWANEYLGNILGPAPSPFSHWLYSFSLPFLILLPCTMAMGATLPVIERFLANHEGKSHLSGLYATNTLGAASGIILSIFFLMPNLGFQGSIFALASCDLLAAILIFVGLVRSEKPTSIVTHITKTSIPKSLVVTLFVTGLLGIAYEILAIRALTQIFQNTIYTYSSALFIYLLGTAIGAAVYQRYLAQRFSNKGSDLFLMSLALSCGLGLFFMSHANSAYDNIRNLREGLLGGILAEMGVAAIVFAIPTVVMGMTFGHLAGQMKKAGHGVGLSFSLNTLGGACASPLFGIILIPLIGLQMSLIVIAVLYLALCQDWKKFYSPLTCLLLLIPLLFVNFELVQREEGDTFVSYEEGITATVAVIEKPDGQRLLKVNNLFIMGGNHKGFIEQRMTAIPTLLHPSPENALFLGLGPGVTFETMADFPSIDATGVELIPEVVNALPYFSSHPEGPQGYENLTVFTADARRFTKTTDRQYDLIIADLFQPARDGAGALYTQEHFASVKEKLTLRENGQTGIFCQWLPFHQMDTETFRIISKTFLSVFPDAYLLVTSYNVNTPTLGLVGGHGPVKFQPHYDADHIKTRTGRRLLRSLSLLDSLDFAGTLLMSNEELVRFCKNNHEVNSDNRPIVSWRAPYLAYSIEDNIENNNVPVRMEQFLIDMHGVAGTDISFFEPKFSSEQSKIELWNFLDARDIYLEGHIAEMAGKYDRSLELYLKSYGTFPRFKPSFFKLEEALSILREENPAFADDLQRVMTEIRNDQATQQTTTDE